MPFGRAELLRAPSACAALAIVATLAAPAQAGNEDSYLFGDQASLTGGAVTASIRDTSAIWYNPAGLGHNRRGRLELSGTAFTARLRPIPDGLVIDLPGGRVSRSIVSREVFVVPASLAVAREVAEGLSLGAGLFATQQDLFDFQRSIRTNDGSIDMDLAGALTGTEIQYHGGPAIGWQATGRLRVGLSLFGVYETRHEFRKLFANASISGGNYDRVFLQRLVDAEASRIGVEAVLGAQLDAGADWELGLSVRSPRWVFDESTQTDNSTALIATGPAATPVTISRVDHDPIGAEGTGFTRPPRFHLGAAKGLGAFDVSAEVELRPAIIGSAAERTVVNVRAGALWAVSDRTELGAGVFSDRSDAGAPQVFPDSRVDYYGASLGWKRHNEIKLRAGEDASTLRFSTTIALRYAMGRGESTRIRFDFRNSPTDGSVARVDDERVDVTYHEASLYLGTGFEF